MFKELKYLLLFCCISSNAFAFSVQSDLIGVDGKINVLYTCKGSNQSPILQVQDVPMGTKSLALTLDDPDAPSGLWTHWVVWNIPPNVKYIKAGMGITGRNSWSNIAYQGPCPPTGLHHYSVKLYALDTLLHLPAGSNSDIFRQNMLGHVLAEAQAMGVMAGK